MQWTNSYDIFNKYNNYWLQELPANHTQCNKTSKINIEIQNTVPGMPVEAT